jgi:uncharacterized protein (DUF488 family)
VQTLAHFLEALQHHDIEHIADVRAKPASWRAPWSNSEVLAASLAGQAVGYVHLSGLGGRRDPVKGSPNHGLARACLSRLCGSYGQR